MQSPEKNTEMISHNAAASSFGFAASMFCFKLRLSRLRPSTIFWRASGGSTLTARMELTEKQPRSSSEQLGASSRNFWMSSQPSGCLARMAPPGRFAK